MINIVNKYIKFLKKIKKSSNLYTYIAISTVILFFIISIALPHSLIGYKRFFNDLRTNTYESNSRFDYSLFRFQIGVKSSEISPILHDCSNLLEGGIFNPNSSSFYARQSVVNYEPKESCIASNENISKISSAKKTLSINYNIENISNSIRTIDNGWISLIAKNGKVIYRGGDSITIAPHSKAAGTISDIIEVGDTTISNALVGLPGLSSQVIKLQK